MTNREEVIRWLRYCDGHAIHTGHGCEKCPYLDGTESGEECVEHLHADAIALLKAQEAVKAYRLHGEKVIDNSEKVFTGQCTNCFCYLVDGWKACPVCGKAVKWDD